MLTSNAKTEPFWIARIAAGGPARLRNPGESAEDYRVAMGWDKPPEAAPERKTRDVAGILHFLTPQQMAEEIVRLDKALHDCRALLAHVGCPTEWLDASADQQENDRV